MEYYLAVDIGASSGRHIIGYVENGKIRLREMYRFENKPVEKNGRMCWDIAYLSRQILEGMKQCKGQGYVPSSMGVDTWGVDYVLLDGKGQPLGDCHCYRGVDTETAIKWVEEKFSFAALYQRTGIQKQVFNTIYQLAARKIQGDTALQQAAHLLMMPDYFHYMLTGKMAQEYTIATTTGMVNGEDKQWDEKVLETLEFPKHLFGALTAPGTVLGTLQPEIVRQVGFTCQVVLPPSHDTASAFLAVPQGEQEGVTLSSGTWSLLGVENKTFLATKETMEANFTNEGGYGYRYRFLKNIMGSWMLQCVRRETENRYSFSELEQLAAAGEGYDGVVDCSDPVFLAPKSMTEAVKEQCEKAGFKRPSALSEVLQCIYHSLALSYGKGADELEKLTGRSYEVIHIVGGGCQADYLNKLTAKYSGRKVLAGPVEGTALGNILVQMIQGKEFDSLEQGRKAIAESFPLQSYT